MIFLGRAVRLCPLFFPVPHRGRDPISQPPGYPRISGGPIHWKGDERLRLDKWLKVSRLIKRRTVANEACDNGRISANGRQVKASYDVRPGDVLELKFGEKAIRVEVLSVAELVGKQGADAMYRQLS